MRILIATGLYPPDLGGPATYSKLLHDELPQHEFEVDVLSFGEVRRLPKGIRHVVYFIKILRRGKKADLIFAQDPVSVGLPALAAATLLRKRFILKVVGDYAWEQGVQRSGVKESLNTFSKKTKGYSPLVYILKRVQTLVAMNAKRIIVPSNYLKTIVANWGVPKKNITVIHNGFKDTGMSAERRVLRDILKFKGTLIVSAGRLVPWKGFELLIKLMPPLLKSFPDLRLLIAGSGPDQDKLEALTTQLKLTERVIFTGALAPNVLLRYIKIADVFVLNTGYEGFSHQLLEVMSLGVPIVTTNIGGNPEIIEHGKTGLLVKYNSKKELEKNITDVLKNKSLSARLAKNARERVRYFSEEKMIKETLIILKS